MIPLAWEALVSFYHRMMYKISSWRDTQFWDPDVLAAHDLAVAHELGFNDD